MYRRCARDGRRGGEGGPGLLYVDAGTAKAKTPCRSGKRKGEGAGAEEDSPPIAFSAPLDSQESKLAIERNRPDMCTYKATTTDVPPSPTNRQVSDEQPKKPVHTFPFQ